MLNKYIFILGIFAPSFLLAAKGEVIHENGMPIPFTVILRPY